jgi:16S rRNA (guanine1516-N2)-methyltransferase
LRQFRAEKLEGTARLKLELAAVDQPLAEKLGINKVCELTQINDEIAVFSQENQQLILNLTLDNKVQQLAFSLDDGDVANRAAKVSKSNELIAKAIGCKSHFRPNVLDATAGMGRDSLIMLMLGCRVTMQERNPAIFILLENAVARLHSNPQIDQSIFERLKLAKANSLDSMTENQELEVIYLDPMFPERKKSALVKKEMRLFKRIAGDDPDADNLLLTALDTSVPRVVVKRPKGSESLANKKPSHQIIGKKFRFDVYLK